MLIVDLSSHLSVYLHIENDSISHHLHDILQSLRDTGIIIDSVEIGESKIPGEGISVHLVLYTKRGTERTEIYQILMQSGYVVSVDFL